MLVGLNAMLVHTCDILRQAAGSASGHGHNTGTWETAYAGVVCRWMENQGTELDEPSYVNVERQRVFFVYGTDVVFGDRLKRDGVEFRIVDVVANVGGAQEFMRVVVERVSGG